MSLQIPVERTVEVARIANRLVPHDWRFARDEAVRIEARWTALRAQKPGLFDGRVLMSRDLAIGEDVMTGTSFETGYKPFLCWREFGYPGEPVKNLFAMPALRAADGPFLLGRMSAGTANGGKLYFPAGTPEPDDVGADGLVDYDGSILRELEEETGISEAEVTLGSRWTILFAGPLVACMKEVRSPLPARELVARVTAFIASEPEPELDGVVAVAGPEDFDPDATPTFMLDYMAAAFRRPQASGEPRSSSL